MEKRGRMQHHQIKLKNHLKTLFIDSPGSTMSSVGIWFRAGSALENSGNHGVAHFLEHMFFKGTTKRPGAAIAGEVESYGGEINAFTSFDYTCYYINSPSSQLVQSVDILMDMVSNPKFAESDIIPERNVVFEEYRRMLDSPGQYAFHQMQQHCFTGNYSHSILGNEKSITNFSRKQLITFRKKFYNSSNSMLVIAGDLKTKDKVIATIEKYSMPKGMKSSFPLFKTETKSSINIHQKDVRMSNLMITIPSCLHTDKKNPAEELAMNCLGHGETSYLHDRLVQKTGICNSASSYTMHMSRGGVHIIKTVFPHKHFKKMLEELNKILKDILSNGIQHDEIVRLKNQYVASKIYDKESLESYSFSLGSSFARTGDINYEYEFIEQIKKTTASQVNTALKNIFKRTFLFDIQIPKSESIKQSENIMKIFNRNFIKSLKSLPTEKSSRPKLSKFDSQIRLVELKKGISLLHRQNKMTPTFVMHAYLKGGLGCENKLNNGQYHILSSMLTQGYDNISEQDIRKIFEDRSASISSFSGKNAYGLTMHGQTEHAQELFEHFTGSLLRPKIPENELKHEKEMTLRMIENQKEDPVKQCFGMVAKLFFNSHPYSMNVIGTEKNIKRINKKTITKLHSSNIKNGEMLITYCGDLDLEDVTSMLTPKLEKTGPRQPKKTVTQKYKPCEKKNVHIEFDREQSQIFIGIPTNNIKSRENIFLKMITAHLSGQSSKLFVEVRDNLGLCYSTQPVHFQALEGGHWGIYMASGNDKTELAIKAIREIISEIEINGLSKKEFTTTKKMIAGQNLLNIQTNEDYANIYSVPVLHGYGVDFFYQNNKIIQDMSYEEFQKNIKQIFKKEFYTVVVGRNT